MRKTGVLFHQHIGWYFGRHWIVQGKRKPLETAAEKILKSKGIAVCDPEDILKENRVFEKVEDIQANETPIVTNTHPDWHNRTLLSYKDNNVLLEGLTQAKIITKTVELQESLPDRIFPKDPSKEINEMAKKIILNSHLFDAEHTKLPKLKDPARPAWNFPRYYGISQGRRNKLMILKLLQLIESTSNLTLAQGRYIFNDLLFSFPFERKGDLIQFELSGDVILTSSKSLSPVSTASTEGLALPNIHPMEPTITLSQENIYRIQKIYPIKPNVRKSHPHTLFVHFDREQVKNLFEEEVTESQIYGRSLLKAFTVAASYARQRYGDDVKALPKPVTLQCVQTDGRFFHFGVFQLNTLELDTGDMKNIWYQTPLQYLFDNCLYKLGKPTLEGYNSEIFKQLNCFYSV